MKHLKIIEAVFTKRLERGGKQQDLDCVLFMGSVSSAVLAGFRFSVHFNGTEISLSFILNATCVLFTGSTYVATIGLDASFPSFSLLFSFLTISLYDSLGLFSSLQRKDA